MSGPTVADLRARTTELLDLSEALSWLVRAGVAVPCRQADSHRAWISNDVVEQVSAALLCGGCPTRLECEAYGMAHRTEFGVYGGRTDPERHLARSPRAKADLAKVKAARLSAETAALPEWQKAAAQSWAAYLDRLSPETVAHLKRVNAARQVAAAATTDATEVGSGTRAPQGTVLIHEGAER